MPGATAGPAFLLDRADDGHLPVGGHRHPRRGGRKHSQRAFRVYGAATVEPAPVPTQRDDTGKGVNVAEEQHHAPTGAPASHGIAGRIAVGIKSVGSHPVHHDVHGLRFASRRTRDREE